MKLKKWLKCYRLLNELKRCVDTYALATDGITKDEGILVYDADGVDGGETVIVLAGTANAAFFAYTDIV